MKSENAHKAADLVGIASKMEHVAKRLLSEEAGDFVNVKVEHRSFSRNLGEVTIPGTYIAKALKDYREAIVLEAESLGVVFDAHPPQNDEGKTP